MTQQRKRGKSTTPESKLYPLTGTYSGNKANLDFKSTLLLKWLDRWCLANGGKKAPHSGLIRRALDCYGKVIEAMPPSEAPDELRAIKRACSSIGMHPFEQSQAEARLEVCLVVAADGSQALSQFDVVLKGQHQVDAMAALMVRLAEVEANHKPIKSRLKKQPPNE